MVCLTDARTPEGMRLYAIGDVHGCVDQLREAHHGIDTDLAARPVGDWRIIHLGDYVDRGPDSCGVIDFLIERQAEDDRILCLRGNHEKMLTDGLAEAGRMRELWINNGGVEALQSYGVSLPQFLNSLGSDGSASSILPGPHQKFLDDLHESVQFGDYYFVHAGIDPNFSLADQTSAAKLWIRAPFLESDQEFAAVIIHGHTPGPEVVVRPNRIGIDTGAVFDGALTCLVLEGNERNLLGEKGRLPLPPIEIPAKAEVLPPPLGRLDRFLQRFRKDG